jgi:hydroxymethylpyrimidine pyrophosphatase-like HAD family hydrolase
MTGKFHGRLFHPLENAVLQGGTNDGKPPAIRQDNLMHHMAPRIRLLSLDFDGTILDYPDNGPVLHPAIIQILNELSHRGIAWVANSGRSLEELKTIVGASVPCGLWNLPQAFLCLECMIFECQGPALRGVEPWNSDMVQILRELHSRVRVALEPRLDEIRERFTDEICLAELYASFRLPEPNHKPAELCDQLRAWLRDVEGVAMTRNGSWVAIHSARAGKGNVLRAYAARTGFEYDEILAIGDHFNDITMLDGTAAGHVGCPADALDEVKDAVRVAGGHVAEREGPLGTAEVIRKYLP